MVAAAMPSAVCKRARAAAWVKVFAAAFALVAALFASRAAFAFTPPPLTGHVVDTAGKLGVDDIRSLDAKLEAIRRQTGFEIVAFVTGTLDGEAIEDVAYDTFNTWQIGRARADNGVLLVIAPSERRVRIETGKGVGGALTDLQSNDIIRRTISPLLAQDRFRDAIDQGAARIADELVAGTPGAERSPERAPDTPGAKRSSPVGLGVMFALFVGALLLAAVSPGFRGLLWILLQVVLFGGGRGGGGFGGGSGYRGGGGRSGGGGSSDSY